MDAAIGERERKRLGNWVPPRGQKMTFRSCSELVVRNMLPTGWADWPSIWEIAICILPLNPAACVTRGRRAANQ
jgi:hypothetical protein